MIARTMISILVLTGTCALMSCASTRSGDSKKSADSATTAASNAAAAGASCSVVAEPGSAQPASQNTGSTPATTPSTGFTLTPGGTPLFGAAPVPPAFSRSMGQISDMYGHLAEVEKAGWTATKDYPMPAADAGKLAQLFRTLVDSEKSKAKPAEFAAIMRKAGDTASSLQTMLAGNGPVDARKASADFAAIAVSCNDCHTKYAN